MENKYKIGESDVRPWGKYKVTDVGTGFIVKQIEVNAGGILSYQRHKYRSEHWIIVQGAGVITLDDKKFPVKANDHFFLPIAAWHRIENNGKVPLVFIEVQTGDNLDESDIERKDDKYSRT